MKVLILINLVLLFGQNCGLLGHHPSRRIVQGLKPNIDDFKFQVAIMSKNKVRCSGTIIAGDAVLTTASCLTTNAGPFTILAGTHDLAGAGHIFTIQKIIKHPKWKRNVFDYDLAIIETGESMTELNETNIEGIQLSFKELPEDAMVNISGWGSSSVANIRSQYLRYATVKVLHWNECINKYPHLRVRDYHGTFCTIGADRESLCWHDQGGPVVYSNTLVGVSIKQVMCMDANVHLGIRSYMEWISNVISTF